MAGRVIGTAEIQVTANTRRFDASLSGIARNIQSALSTPIGKAASHTAEQLGKIGHAVRTGMETALGGAAVAIGGFLTTALTTGYNRFTTIQDATARLTVVLGSASDASKLLGDVLKVVEGTPFRLDQFSSAAAMLVGFGVDAQKVPPYLEAIGEAAASMGSRAPEAVDMLTTAFSQMQSQGRVTGDALWSLGQVGIDAATILGNHFGVTAAEARKMVSEGLVPAEEGMDALTEGIINGSEGAAGSVRALGGQMQALGTTLSGAVANMRTSFARLGARVWTAFGPGLTRIAGAIEDTFDKIGETISPIIQRWADSPGFQKLVEWFESLPEKVGPAIDKISELGDTVGPLLGGAFALAGGGIKGFLGPFGALIPSINPVVGMILGLILGNEELRGTFMDLLTALMPLVEQIGGEFMAALEELMPSLVELLENLAPVVLILGEELVLAIQLVLPILTELVQMVIDFIAALPPPVLAAIAAGLATLWLVGFGPVGWVIAAIAAVTAVILYFKDDIIRIFHQVMDWLSENWPLIIAIITGPIGVIVYLVIKYWDEIFAFIKGIVTAIKDWLVGAWNAIKDKAAETWAAIKAKVVEAWTAIKTWLSNLWTSIKDKAAEIWNAIKTKIGEIIDNIKAAISEKWESIKSAVTDKLNAIKSKIQEIWNSIVDWVKNKIDSLKTSISEKFTSIKTTIGDKIEDAKNLVKGKIDSIVGFFQDLPGRILSGLGNIASQIADKLTPNLPGVVTGALGAIGGIFSHAEGGVFTRPHIGLVGEAGPEAVVPLNNQRRAMEVMGQAGLLGMGRGGPLVQMNGTTIQDATDADLVAQRTVASMAALLVAS